MNLDFSSLVPIKKYYSEQQMWQWFVWQHVNIRYAPQKTEDSVSSVSAAFDITEESVHNIYISSIDCSSEYSTDIVTYIRKAQWKQHLFHFCLIIMSCFIGFWIYWKRNLSYIWVGRSDFGMYNVQCTIFKLQFIFKVIFIQCAFLTPI